MVDPIFKNQTDLKREYRILIKNILPSLNDCGYCGKVKCIYFEKFSVDCSYCKTKCQNCHEFNKSKDLLINCGDEQISNYIKKFLIDYFNASDLTNFFFNMNITNEVKRKDPISIVKVCEENKIEPHVTKEKTDKKFFYCKSKKHMYYFKIN